MCTNYGIPDRQLFSNKYGVGAPSAEWWDEVYKDYFAPIICRDSDGRRSEIASFGMVRERIPPGHVCDDRCSRQVGLKATPNLAGEG